MRSRALVPMLILSLAQAGVLVAGPPQIVRDPSLKLGPRAPTASAPAVKEEAQPVSSQTAKGLVKLAVLTRTVAEATPQEVPETPLVAQTAEVEENFELPGLISFVGDDEEMFDEPEDAGDGTFFVSYRPNFSGQRHGFNNNLYSGQRAGRYNNMFSGQRPGRYNNFFSGQRPSPYRYTPRVGYSGYRGYGGGGPYVPQSIWNGNRGYYASRRYNYGGYYGGYGYGGGWANLAYTAIRGLSYRNGCW